MFTQAVKFFMNDVRDVLCKALKLGLRQGLCMQFSGYPQGKNTLKKTQVFQGSVNMDFFIGVFYIETNYFKKQSSCWQNSVLCDRSLLYSPYYFAFQS